MRGREEEAWKKYASSQHEATVAVEERESYLHHQAPPAVRGRHGMYGNLVAVAFGFGRLLRPVAMCVRIIIELHIRVVMFEVSVIHIFTG